MVENGNYQRIGTYRIKKEKEYNIGVMRLEVESHEVQESTLICRSGNRSTAPSPQDFLGEFNTKQIQTTTPSRPTAGVQKKIQSTILHQVRLGIHPPDSAKEFTSARIQVLHQL